MQVPTFDHNSQWRQTRNWHHNESLLWNDYNLQLTITTYNYNLQVTNNDSSNEILKAIKTYVDEKNNVKHLSWQMEQIDGW
jgi:hypothetical protein